MQMICTKKINSLKNGNAAPIFRRISNHPLPHRIDWRHEFIASHLHDAERRGISFGTLVSIIVAIKLKLAIPTEIFKIEVGVLYQFL